MAYHGFAFFRANFVHLSLAVILLGSIPGCSASGQDVVIVTIEAGEGFVGFMKVLTCQYAWRPPCPNVNCTIEGILWKKGSAKIIYLHVNHEDADNVTYFGVYNNSNYIVSTMDVNTGCNLTIQSVTQGDSGNYTCDVYTRSPTSQSDTGQAELTVRTLVPPSTITLAYNGMTYRNGGSIPVAVGDGRQFTCNTPDVYPQTTFTWTLPLSITIDQPLGIPTSSPNTDDTVDSSNTITVSIPENPATSQLSCGATNRLDGSTQPDVIITVTLQIKVPPKEVQLLSSDGELGDSLAVDQGINYNLQCKVPATRPAASIRWLVSDVEPATGVEDPTSTLNNGLYDTSGTWSFTPDRTHHKQEVKCVANTNESTEPYPEDTAIINVIGPPDTPEIKATSPMMTENVTATLTCTADMGYPDDWSLNWLEASLPDPTSTTSSPSGQRYSFTRELNFTPTRQDNGETIKCTARRNGWSGSEPEGSLILNVQYSPNITNKNDNEAGAKDGDDETLTCIAEGNPTPTISWYDPNNTLITSGSKYSMKESTSGNNVLGYEVTGTLTIHGVDSERDYGLYTCNASNDIGVEDMLMIYLNGTRRPDPPRNVKAIEMTSDSITVSWTPGYDGGEDQRFIVTYLKTNSGDSETPREPITGGENMYTITGLEADTEYEFRVYAENGVGKNPNYGKTVAMTLKKVRTTHMPRGGGSVGTVIGAVVGCSALLFVIVIAIWWKRKTSSSKKPFNEDVPTAVKFENAPVAGNSDAGIADTAFQNGSQEIHLTEEPPKVQLLPENDGPIYAKTEKKKPKKFVPPSKVAGSTGNKPRDKTGRIISDDGLIYTEVAHGRAHPPNQPPIQTEETTQYASLDFNRMKTGSE